MKIMIGAVCGYYSRSDKGEGKGISFFSIPNPRIKPEKKDLAARLGQDG